MKSPAFQNARLKESVFQLVKSFYLVFCLLSVLSICNKILETWICIDFHWSSNTIGIYSLIYKYNIQVACWVVLWLDMLEIAIVGEIEPCWLHSNANEPSRIK